MTTQLLYHALGVDGYTATRCWETEGVFCLQMEAPSSCHRCPKCGRGDVIHRGTFDRTVHAPPIGTCRTQLFIKVRWTPKTGPGNKVDFPRFNFGGEDGR
jgi:hypothetical protein